MHAPGSRCVSLVELNSSDCMSGSGQDNPPRYTNEPTKEPISIGRLQEDLYLLDLQEQSSIRNIDASVGDVKQELLDIQSAFNYYRTRLNSHSRETDRAWGLIQRHKNGLPATPVSIRTRPPPYRVFRSQLTKKSSTSCEDLSSTGSGIDRRWSISLTRLNSISDLSVAGIGGDQKF